MAEQMEMVGSNKRLQEVTQKLKALGFNPQVVSPAHGNVHTIKVTLPTRVERQEGARVAYTDGGGMTKQTITYHNGGIVLVTEEITRQGEIIQSRRISFS